MRVNLTFPQVKFASKFLSLRDASFFLSNFRAVPNVSENRPVSDIQIHDAKLAAACESTKSKIYDLQHQRFQTLYRYKSD